MTKQINNKQKKIINCAQVQKQYASKLIHIHKGNGLYLIFDNSPEKYIKMTYTVTTQYNTHLDETKWTPKPLNSTLSINIYPDSCA